MHVSWENPFDLEVGPNAKIPLNVNINSELFTITNIQCYINGVYSTELILETDYNAGLVGKQRYTYCFL